MTTATAQAFPNIAFIKYRLDKLTQGPGVIVRRKAKYYRMNRIPTKRLRDEWLNRSLCIERGAIDAVPGAICRPDDFLFNLFLLPETLMSSLIHPHIL